jgi:ring-1,2-phenylacetyl-CoA epoxidase subunit PaaB
MRGKPMTDTQWPRFVVFLQPAVNEPHQYVGSVHAPDAEMALLNARDVFVRRPECISLWIVTASIILAKTAEELAKEPLPETLDSALLRETYHIFQKLTHKGTFVYQRDTEAASPPEAVRQAVESPALAVWVFPARYVTRSEADDAAPMFAPAHDKTPFRDQTEFRITTTMQQIKRGQDDEV